MRFDPVDQLPPGGADGIRRGSGRLDGAPGPQPGSGATRTPSGSSRSDGERKSRKRDEKPAN
jgi:hypothetical protein